jgi:hypothetical protein
MPTTTNFGWTTPADTDLVKDGAAAIRTLGSNIDTSLVDLKGGTTGQVLSKASGTDLDFTFTTISATPTSEVATVATDEQTSSSSYTDLTTSGPAVTLTTGTKVLVIMSALAYTDGANQQASADFAVSGATTRAASDATRLSIRSAASGITMTRASSASRITVTAGSNTFTAKYKTSAAGTAYFSDRQILVIDLGS